MKFLKKKWMTNKNLLYKNKIKLNLKIFLKKGKKEKRAFTMGAEFRWGWNLGRGRV